MMMKSHLFWRAMLILGALVALGIGPAWAGGEGKIAGTVKDAKSGEVLVGANISLVDTKLGTTADNKGRFFILNVPPGIYTLKITYIGYAAYTVEEVRVSADLTTTLEAKLSSADIQVQEMVVKAEKPIIDKNATNAVRIVGTEDLEIMPFRGVQNVFALQAGVVEDEGALHVRGSREDEIGYYVEGANVRNVVTGTTAVGLIDEAVEEIQLQAGGFNAEYGGANAGVILQELRTGGAKWDVGLLSESDGFTSKYKKNLGTYSYGYSNQVLTLSGPLLGSDKIRTFLATQRRVRDSDPVFWEGFDFKNLVDTGNRGDRVHWKDRDKDGTPEPDTLADLRLEPGNIAHTGRTAFDFNGTLLFDYNPIQLRVTGLYTAENREFNPAPIRNMLNLERQPEADRTSGLLNVKGTHILNPSLFYELNFSLYNQDRDIYDPVFDDNFIVYDDSAAAAKADPSFTRFSSQGSVPQPYDLAGFPFHRPGTPVNFIDGDSRFSLYGKEKDQYWGLAGSMTKQTQVHQIKAGFDLQEWTSRRFGLFSNNIRSAIQSRYPQLEAVFQDYYAGKIAEDDVLDALIAKAESIKEEGKGTITDLKTLIRSTSRADFYGYDEFGRQQEGSGLDGPRQPTLAAGYIQDKIEYRDLIINAGLRWDYFDVDSWRFKDQAAPVRDEKKFTLDTNSMQKTRTFSELSPRLGLSFPVSDLTVFHVQYGRFSQMPALRDMFTGGARLAVEMGGQNYIRFPTAFDVEPIRTTQYEIGFERQFTDAASFDITGFYRDVKGQIQIRKQELGANAVGVGAFNYLQNGDFATTKGIEFVFKLRRVNRIRAELNYTLSDARGTGSSISSAVSGVENATNLPTIISPLDFNETHRGSFYLDYRFAEHEGGPILERLGANLLFHFSSGHNFTLVNGGIGQRGPEEGGILASDDPRSRKPVESINTSTTPWIFQTDLRVDKGFTLFGINAQAYAYIQNLFNRRNVVNVYGRTGNAKDDGFLTDPELSEKIVEASGGLEYQRLYQAINLANRQNYWFAEGGDIYDEPRQLRFGLKFGL
ncbi:MAG: carboxypeptidase-like regulatory domain-containing protein [Candidatus Latescibacteria bacterium]|nr:carboxypeptidase-like regulatory domain-containing protein [Candidatus Latescibacterota bacterium]